MNNHTPKVKYPTNRYGREFSSTVRDIKIFLPNDKNSRKDGEDDPAFVGRERIMERLRTWLQSEGGGSYLVTGFRGMGKTTIVNRVLGEMQKITKSWVTLLVIITLVVAVVLSFLFFCQKNTECKWWLILIPIPIILPCILTIEYFCSKSKKDGKYCNLKIDINLGHDVLHERDVLSLIATKVKDEYSRYVQSLQPVGHCLWMGVFVAAVCAISIALYKSTNNVINDVVKDNAMHTTSVYIEEPFVKSVITTQDQTPSVWKRMLETANSNWYGRLLLFTAIFAIVWFALRWVIMQLPWLNTPWRALRRLNKLTERIASVTSIENGTTPTLDNKILNISLFSHRRNRTIPMADVREIEAELADIINSISTRHSCLCGYTAKFFIVFDEMDKIDPALMEQPAQGEMPEFSEGVKGFPDGMDSRERRRSVLKLLANIKLFVGSAKAKFIFISG